MKRRLFLSAALGVLASTFHLRKSRGGSETIGCPCPWTPSSKVIRIHVSCGGGGGGCSSRTISIGSGGAGGGFS